MNHTTMRITITKDELELYVAGRRVVDREQVSTSYPELRASRLQRFIERYEDKLLVYVLANKHYFDREELDNLLNRLDEQNNADQ